MSRTIMKNILVGGGLIPRSMGKDTSTTFLGLMLLGLVILLIKGILVMLTYNIMMPKMMYNYNSQYNVNEFRRMNLIEAILMVILFNNLFSSY
jgi:hypothetical protein